MLEESMYTRQSQERATGARYCYCNDETWDCKVEDKNRLKEKNNAMLQGFEVVATGRIEAGQEIKFTYNLD